MTIPKRKLGELGEFRNGLNYSKENFGTGLKVISVKDFGDRWRPDLTILDEISPAGMRIANSNLQRGDIVFVRSNGNKDLIGRSMLIEDDLEDVSFSGFCIRFRPNNPNTNSRFLSLFFRTPLFRRVLSQQGKGTNINNLNQSILERMEVPFPQPIVQGRITEVASAYDDLIETNRRRIALLEEAARLLYREWFIHFRFPGHEHVSITDGLPVGWEQRTLGDLLTLKRGYDLPHQKRVQGDVPIVSSSGVTGYHNEKKADGPGIVTGRYGTIGEVYIVDQDYWPLNTALYVSDKKGNPPIFLFHALRQTLVNIQSEKAAVPGLNRNTLHTIRTGIPPFKLRRHFEEAVEPLFVQRRTLTSHNQKLAQARDLLLPRLMKGEIAV